ncbi:hypothetical protein CDAR_185481 [Caerostris darwini]|uniref:Uncharacterized protein n=1 Tax=Caerostris darwini TaxID=1538125 RepID=A0AAV4QPW5_9ARAC|nr:hypothetical protein CDAR_185481 [Caerostris darwini]
MKDSKISNPNTTTVKTVTDRHRRRGTHKFPTETRRQAVKTVTDRHRRSLGNRKESSKGTALFAVELPIFEDDGRLKSFSSSKGEESALRCGGGSKKMGEKGGLPLMIRKKMEMKDTDARDDKKQIWPHARETWQKINRSAQHLII